MNYSPVGPALKTPGFFYAQFGLIAAQEKTCDLPNLTIGVFGLKIHIFIFG